MAGVELHSLPHWEPRQGAWRFELSLTPANLRKGRGIPDTSEWVVFVGSNYPYGAIEFYPAIEGGITGTYQHQLPNLLAKGRDWTSGKICEGLSDGQLGRLAKTPETFEDARLAWHVNRAMAWLEAASKSELTQDGDPWEKPHFSGSGDAVVHLECTLSCEFWRKSKVHSGFTELVRQGDKRFVGGFYDRDGVQLLAPAWGSLLARQKNPQRVPWLLLPRVPVLKPWRGPFDWYDLREACRDQGIDLDAELAPLMDAIRPRSARRRRHKRRRQRPASGPIALIGFPIKRTVGGPDVFIHWQALRLPPLTETTAQAVVNPANAKQLWEADRQSGFADDARINWLPSENWHIEQVSSRGSLSPRARDRRVGVIGAGVLGAALCELLARTGLWQFVLVDREDFAGGNLSRHTLTLEAVNEPKAKALAKRLELINPRISVQPIMRQLEGLSEDEWWALDDCEVVLDTTGSDAVINAIAAHAWSSPKLFVSASLAADAEKMFLFAAYGDAFPTEELYGWINPIMEEERKRVGPPIMEGAGCFYPVTPARYDRIMALSAMAIPKFETWFDAGLSVTFSQEIRVPAIT
jgi:hypothetical protein